MQANLPLDPERDMWANSIRESKRHRALLSDDLEMRLLTETTHIEPNRDESE